MTTLSIMTLSIVSFNMTIFSIKTLNTTLLSSIRAPSIIAFNMMIFSIVAPSIITFKTVCLIRDVIMSFNILHLMYLHSKLIYNLHT
jgi:hypothetical protein